MTQLAAQEPGESRYMHARSSLVRYGLTGRELRRNGPNSGKASGRPNEHEAKKARSGNLRAYIRRMGNAILSRYSISQPVSVYKYFETREAYRCRKKNAVRALPEYRAQ